MAKPLHVTLPHNLSQAEAQRRIEEGLARVRPQILHYVTSLEISGAATGSTSR